MCNVAYISKLPLKMYVATEIKSILLYSLELSFWRSAMPHRDRTFVKSMKGEAYYNVYRCVPVRTGKAVVRGIH